MTREVTRDIPVLVRLDEDERPDIAPLIALLAIEDAADDQGKAHRAALRRLPAHTTPLDAAGRRAP